MKIYRLVLQALFLLGLWLGLGMQAHAQMDTVTYVYTDLQGTPLVHADAQGNVIARYDYTPYGNMVASLGNPPDGPGYTGHVYDPESGLVYMQQRYYQPIGRFPSPDPVRPSAGSLFTFNRYDYVNNNPIANIDPNGKTCRSVGKSGGYSCVVDKNLGHLKGEEITRLNKAYTSAVNILKKNSSRTVTVTVDGKSFRANAGRVADALIGAMVVTSAKNTGDRGSTYGGGIGSGGSKSPIWQPVLTIYSNVLYKNREGGTGTIESDISRTFVHEGIHMLPGESVMYDMYRTDPTKYKRDHQDRFNRASDELYDGGL